MIGDGRILSDGSLADLRARAGPERWLTVDLSADVEIEDPDASLIERASTRRRFAFDPGRVSAPELIARLASRYPVSDVFVEEPPIETIIARIYARRRAS